MDSIFQESMISSSFKCHLQQILGRKITQIMSVSGGDISSAYCLHTSTNRFFCKVNQSEYAPTMFITEQLGLAEISATKTIKVPLVIDTGQYKTYSYILMEYIESKNPSSKDMEVLGSQLAALHKSKTEEPFGWKQDNFIGSLPQSNKHRHNWIQFYVRERLIPQLKLARNKDFLSSNEIPKEEQLLKGCEKIVPLVKPSLIHGDLWSGNYMIRYDGTPYLIDPAVYVGHYEVDLAMTQLFGGFSSSFYKAHEAALPLENLYNERKDIYQLYYLLVHLNLFGSSYYVSVNQILKRYFK